MGNRTQVRARTGSRNLTTIDAVWAVGREIGCDYQNVILPFAVGWDVARTFNMLKTLTERKDSSAENFLEEFEYPSPTSLAIEHAPSVKFGLDVDSVSPDRKMWLTSNPGRQILTGSFHPIDDDLWAAEVHLPPGEHKYVRITLVGGLAASADPPGNPWDNPDPERDERRRLGLVRRRFWRALFNAFPDLNNAIFKYDAEIIAPDSPNWETSTKVESSRWARWEKPGMVLRTAASPLDADELRAMVARFCHDGDVDITYEEFAVVVAEPPEKPAAPPPREDPLLRCAACKRKLVVPNRCSRCRAVSFCNKHCFKAAWPVHKLTCAPPSSPISGGS